MFLLVATLHRLTRRPEGIGRGTLLAVAGLSVLLYLSHLLAWVMGGVAVVVFALVLARQGRRRTAVHLVAGLVPGAVLAAWYTLAEHGGSGITLYPSWREKAIALPEALLFFLRSDPFPPVLPLFWVNLAAALAFAGIVLSQLDMRRTRTAVATRPVLWLSGILALVALVLPISTVNDLIKPDERFVAPALLLAIAALPYRTVRRRMTALGPVLAAAVVTLHLVEYVDVGQQIATVDAAIDAAVPDGTSVLHLTVPAPSGCAPGAGPVTGVPVLKWFAVDHALEGGPALVNIEETSLVHARGSMPADATVLDLDATDVTAAVLAAGYPHIEVVACPADLAAVRQQLAPRYAPVAEGDAYAILARTRAGQHRCAGRRGTGGLAARPADHPPARGARRRRRGHQRARGRRPAGAGAGVRRGRTTLDGVQHHAHPARDRPRRAGTAHSGRRPRAAHPVDQPAHQRQRAAPHR